MSLAVGTLVRLKVPCLGNAAGALGFVFNDYGDGCQVVFSNGMFDGFGDRGTEEDKLMHRAGYYDDASSGDEVGMFLEILEQSDLNYQFTNVLKLAQDFQNGYFDSVLKRR